MVLYLFETENRLSTFGGAGNGKMVLSGNTAMLETGGSVAHNEILLMNDNAMHGGRKGNCVCCCSSDYDNDYEKRANRISASMKQHRDPRQQETPAICNSNNNYYNKYNSSTMNDIKFAHSHINDVAVGGDGENNKKISKNIHCKQNNEIIRNDNNTTFKQFCNNFYSMRRKCWLMLYGKEHTILAATTTVKTVTCTMQHRHQQWTSTFLLIVLLFCTGLTMARPNAVSNSNTLDTTTTKNANDVSIYEHYIYYALCYVTVHTQYSEDDGNDGANVPLYLMTVERGHGREQDLFLFSFIKKHHYYKIIIIMIY